MKKILSIILVGCLVLAVLWIFVFKKGSQKEKTFKPSTKIVRKKISDMPKVQKPAPEQPSQTIKIEPAVAPETKISPQVADKTAEKPAPEDKVSEKPAVVIKTFKKPVIEEKAAEKPAPEPKIAKKLPPKVKATKKSAPVDLDMAYREREPFHPYSLRVSSNRLKKNAQKQYNYYQGKGLSPFFVKLDLGKNGVWWNLHVGHYKVQAEAEKAKKANKLHDALIRKMPYANLIGEFSSKKEMGDQFRRLETLGYYPYIIIGPKNTIRLLVGDFFEHKGAAERNQKRLKADGIQSRFVKR